MKIFHSLTLPTCLGKKKTLHISPNHFSAYLRKTEHITAILLFLSTRDELEGDARASRNKSMQVMVSCVSLKVKMIRLWTYFETRNQSEQRLTGFAWAALENIW